MSVDRSCECGAIIPAYVLGCKACGRKYKVRDEFLVGQEILPEPPVGMWAQQFEDSKNRKEHRVRPFSLLKKVRKDNERKFTFSGKYSHGSKRSFKDIASLFTFILIGIVVIFSAFPGGLKDSVKQKLGLQEEFSLNFQEDEFQFKFLKFADNGVPAYFKGCGSIDYYVRQNYASEDDLSDVSDALSIIGSGIGRPFTFKGTTQERDITKPNSVLIDFTSGLESEEIQDTEAGIHQDIAGLGGPANYEFTNSPRFQSLAATSGNIWIKQESWQNLSRDEKLIVVMHEMGHVLGLDHPTNGSNQIMDAGGYHGTSLGSGDELGLQILSALAGCRDFPDYLTLKSTENSATDKNVSQNNESDVYLGEDNVSGQARLERSLISIGLNSCGNEFPEAVQKLNDEIPETWQMLENDGCGSGRTYTWANPRDISDFVLLEFGASVGWCQEIDPDDLDEIAYNFLPDFTDFQRWYDFAPRFMYFYERGSNDYSQNIFGILEIGSPFQFCGDGHTLLEVGEKVRSNDQQFTEVITAVYGEF